MLRETICIFPFSPKFYSLTCTAIKNHLCIHFLGTALLQSQFPHSCVCERFKLFPGLVHIFPAGIADRSLEYINRSQKHECGNWECDRAIPFLGIFVSNIRYWFFAVSTTPQFLIFLNLPSTVFSLPLQLGIQADPVS